MVLELSSAALRALCAKANSSKVWPSWLLLGLSALCLLLLAWKRPTARLLRGDESTYLAMASSLVRDGDLEFTWSDRIAAERLGPETSVILQRNGKELAYSKPILYPALLAPFLFLGGEWGSVLLNLLAIGVGSWVLHRALARRWDRAGAARTMAVLLGAGSALAWVGWRMGEALQLGFALAACGLLLVAELPASSADRRRVRLASPALGAGLLCGALISLREPNAALLLGLAAASLGLRRVQTAFQLALGASVTYALLLLATVALTGSPWPYKAERTTFSVATGWPVGPGSETALDRFGRDDAWATSSLGLLPTLLPEVSGYSLLYFLCGRHTGLLAYAPGALSLGLIGLYQGRARWWLLGPLGLAVFYLLWLPENYFGGETFIGNRYFLPGLAFLPLALGRPPSWRQVIPAWAVAALAGGSAWVSQARAPEDPPTSQLHAYAGLFRLLPYESTAPQIDGRRDRYWSEELVRFVDPYAAAASWSFELAAGSPPAELLLARFDAERPVRLLVLADGPARLVWRDWMGSGTFELRPTGSGSFGGWIALRPSPPWRIHRFWWDPHAWYRASLVRFWLDSPREGTRARVRYLGALEPPREGFDWELGAVSVPEVVSSGSTLWVPVRIRNRSAFSWSSEAVLPVQLGARLWDGVSNRPVWEGRTPLPRSVPPGEEVLATARIDFPSEPGRYRVELDLVMEDVTWFGEKVGRPILALEINAEPLAAREAPPVRSSLPADTPFDRTAASPN